MTEIKQINIDEIHELEKEWISQEDVDYLLKDNNLTSENLEKKIAELDWNKQLSETEKKLYNILKEIHWIVNLKNTLNQIHEKIRTQNDIINLELIEQYRKNIKFIKRKSKELQIQIDPTIQKEMGELIKIDPYKLNSDDLKKYSNKMSTLIDKFRNTVLEKPKKEIPKNITIEELKNKFKKSNLKESMEIIIYIYDNNKKNNEFNIIKNIEDVDVKKTILVDTYLDSLTEQWKYKEVEEFLDNEISQSLIWKCASPKKVAEIRWKILEIKKAEVIKLAREHYKETWEDHTLSNWLIQVINKQIETKKNEDWCAIDFITAISEFERQNRTLLEKKWIERLKDEQIQQLIDWILSVKKSENDLFIAKWAKALNMDEWEFKEKVQNNNFDETERKKLKTKWINILKLHEKLKSNTYIADIRTKVNNFSEEEIKFITQHPWVDSKTLKKQIYAAREWKIQLKNIDNTDYKYSISENWINTETKSITLKNDTTLDLSDEEFKELNIKDWKVWNPEALKNLIDVKERLDKLWLEFVWENRKSILKIMNNDSDLKISWVNATDENLIDKREFNVLLQFILKIYWDKNPSTVESTNYARILQINEVWAISDKKDFHSWLSNIGKKFVEIWYFNSTWWINVFWEDKLRQYVRNWYKIKK